MTEMLEQLAFICVGIAFIALLLAMVGYFLSKAEWQGWSCVFAMVLLGASIFREVRLRRDLTSPTQ